MENIFNSLKTNKLKLAITIAITLFCCCILCIAISINTVLSDTKPEETSEIIPPTLHATTEIPIAETLTVQALLTDAAFSQTQASIELEKTPGPTLITLTKASIIINVKLFLNQPMSEIEKYVGEPIETFPIEPGESLADTEGGQSITYKLGKYSIFIDYDKHGIAKLFQFYDGLSEEEYQLEDYVEIMQRLGFDFIPPPDIVAEARYGWSNYEGYTINIIKNGITPESVVWSVQIYITP